MSWGSNWLILPHEDISCRFMRDDSRRVPVQVRHSLHSKLKTIPTKKLAAHLSLWSRFEFLVYWILIACENNNWFFIMVIASSYFIVIARRMKHRSKFFLSCWFSSTTNALIDHTLRQKKCTKLVKYRIRSIFGQRPSHWHYYHTHNSLC